MGSTGAVIAGFRSLAARGDTVVLEGLHALKHALRFGAQVHLALTPDPDAVLALAADLAPDVVAALAALLTPVPAAGFAALSARPPASPVLAVAARPVVDLAGVLVRDDAPVVLLDEPRHAGNAGAVVRVAAAAGARAVLVTCGLDPWSPAVVRAAAGLHLAVDVAALREPWVSDRPLVALDPAGRRFTAAALPGGALLAFGSERHGLSPSTLARADDVVSLPMREGVSSLNLATSVAAVLYAWRLGRGH